MATTAKSRWANEDEDAAFEAQKKKEKEDKKRAKAEKQRQLDEIDRARLAEPAVANGALSEARSPRKPSHKSAPHPAKRRKVEETPAGQDEVDSVSFNFLRFPAPEWGPCRHVDNFEKLNHIEEGSYGWVSRARETVTGEIVALKKLKMIGERSELPVTGLREIQTLMVVRHENIVKLREVVVSGSPNE